MKSFIFVLALAVSATALAAPHETVCGGKAVEATQALLRLNNNKIVSFTQDASSMKLVDYKHQGKGSFELWDTALNVVETNGTTYRSTTVRTLVNVEFGSSGSVACTIRKISTPFAD